MRSDSAIAGSASWASVKFVCMRLNAGVHPSGSKDSSRVEPLFHPSRERCKAARLRLKDLDACTHRHVGAVEGRVAAAGGGGAANEARARVGAAGDLHPHEAA